MSNNNEFNICKTLSSLISTTISFTFWKKKLFVAKYFLRLSFKHLIKKIIFFLLMILPLFMFFFLFVPSLFNRYPIFFYIPVSLPHIYTLEGKVQDQNKTNLADITIAIGGFNTETNEHGKFKLIFLAKKNKDIPIVFSRKGNDEIKKIDYLLSHKIDQTFYLKE